MALSEPEYFSQQVLSAKRFFRNQTPLAGVPVVVGGGKELCREDFYINRSSLPFVILEFVSAGKGYCKIEDQEYQLDPGTLIYYGPEHPHVISAIPGEQLHKYFLTVLPYEQIPAEDLYGKVFHCSEPMSILSSFEELIKYGLDPSPKARMLCSSIFRLLLDKCRFHYIEYGEQHDMRFRSYVRCKTVMAENYLAMHTLQEASEQCAVTEAYLCKLFARYDHQSPYSYLMNLRMNRAASMIIEQNLSVKEVASYFGYEDQGHFTRAFKRVFGAPPSEFRA